MSQCEALHWAHCSPWTNWRSQAAFISLIHIISSRHQHTLHAPAQRPPDLPMVLSLTLTTMCILNLLEVMPCFLFTVCAVHTVHSYSSPCLVPVIIVLLLSACLQGNARAVPPAVVIRGLLPIRQVTISVLLQEC